jgi:type I restriction enzyme S subunit
MGLIPQRDYFDKDIANSDNTNGYYIIEHDDFVYNPRKSSDAPYGPISRYAYPDAGIVSPLYLCFRAKGNVDTNFFEWYFHSSAWHRYIYMTGDSGARHDRVSIKDDDFFSMPIRFPSGIEQKKIAAFLNTIEQRITSQQLLVDNLKKYKRGLLNYVFSSKLHHKNVWIGKRIGEFCSIIMGQSPDSNSYNSEGIGVPLVQGNADITDGVTTPRRYTSQPTKMCKEGSILVSVRAPVGTVSLADREICLGRGVCAINSENNAFVRQLFLYLEPSWKTIEQGGTFTAINRDDIENVEVIIPDNTNEQKQIGEYLGMIDLRISQEEKMLQSSVSIRLGLMQQLFI